MRAGPFLLRILLCIALTLNGMAPAMAYGGHGKSARSAAGVLVSVDRRSDDADHDALAVEDAAGDGCHDEAAAVTRTQDDAGRHPPAGRGDCCKHGACSCNCAQHCPASILSGLAIRALVPVSSEPIRPLTVGHRAPSLPHLIRPPIV